MSKPLLPTGSCFDDVANYIRQKIFSGQIHRKHLNSDAFRIVHAICLLEDGEPYAHCWIEAAGTCLDGRILEGKKVMVQYPKKKFYKLIKAQHTAKYTLQEAYDLEVGFGYPGPWVPEIRDLCSDIKRAKQTEVHNEKQNTA